MGKPSRDKGRRGETAAKRLLVDRDWQIIADTTAGISTEDLIATCPDGVFYSVEVKNTKALQIATWRKQAVANAKKLPWLLMMKVDGTGSWLILGRNRRAVVWHEKESTE